MRILMVSNLYPPFVIGGYEMRCALVAQALQQRGHDVCVVTSSFGCGEPRREPESVEGIPVYRSMNEYNFAPRPVPRVSATSRLRHLLTLGGIRLSQEPGNPPWLKVTVTEPQWFFDLPFHPPNALRGQYADFAEFRRIIDQYAPEIINWWNLAGMCKAILAVPQQRGIPDVHWIEDLWMRELGTDSSGDSLKWDSLWTMPWGRRRYKPLWSWAASLFCQSAVQQGIPLRLGSLTSDYGCFVSEFQRLAHRGTRIHFRDSRVIYGGTQAERFLHRRDWNSMASRRDPLRLLYSGAITESRRLHILLDALELMDIEQRKRYMLSILGKPPIERAVSYYDAMRNRVSQSELRDVVVFAGQVPYDEMAQVFAKNDILVFPSSRPEGLPLTLAEAMLAGCCVITSGSGGAGEVALVADLPLFAVDSAPYLCQLLLKLEEDRQWMVECARRGQSVALEKFTFSRMVDEFELVLKGLTS